MEFEQFAESVKELIQETWKDAGQVTLRRVPKNNGESYLGITVEYEEENISPILYLEPYYRAYQKDGRLEELLPEMENFFRNSRDRIRTFNNPAEDPEQYRKELRVKVINRKKNNELLKQVPHMDVLDLALICYWELRIDGEQVVMNVQNELIKKFSLDWKELLDRAIQNTIEESPFRFEPMEQILGVPLGDGSASECYVLTNKNMLLGAVCMFYPGLLDQIYEEIKDDFFILPSSIHEVLILPFRGGFHSDELRDIVREVNATQVAPEEILSDEIYCYKFENKSLAILKEKS